MDEFKKGNNILRFVSSTALTQESFKAMRSCADEKNWQWPTNGYTLFIRNIRPLKYRHFSRESDASINSYRESKNIKNVELGWVSVDVPASWHVALKTRRFATYKLQVVRIRTLKHAGCTVAIDTPYQPGGNSINKLSLTRDSTPPLAHSNVELERSPFVDHPMAT
ncbi:LOW QUALITY PROTEIN: hypothetical protein V1478_008320 [Vespula squamosa]|uniref:Uncharacterized protein n=1 Tax=Vespula squamosa TaxID=30214 RepID=A0ABD2AZD0_VESSQ